MNTVGIEKDLKYLEENLKEEMQVAKRCGNYATHFALKYLYCVFLNVQKSIKKKLKNKG